MVRADSWNFEDVFQEADTLELSPPLGKPEPEIKDSANHYAILKRFLEDETMMLNIIEFVGSLELKCSWKWKVAKIMSNFMESFTARVKPQNGLARSLAGQHHSKHICCRGFALSDDQPDVQLHALARGGCEEHRI